MTTSSNHQPFDSPTRVSQSLCNDRCQTILYKAVFEHFREINTVAALLVASKSFQNSSFGANFLVNFRIDQNSILFFNAVLAPSSCLSIQFVPSLYVAHLWSLSAEINRGLANRVGQIVNTKYFHLSLRSLTLDSVSKEMISCFFQNSTSNAWQHLHFLAVRNCELNDSVLEIISKNALQLRTLSFSRSLGITDAGIEFVSSLSGITSLGLYGCSLITESGLLHVSKLSNITFLDLGGCYTITDAGLAYVSKLSSITSLDLSFCDKITSEAITQFKTALPDCVVFD